MHYTSALLTIAAHHFNEVVEFYRLLLQQEPVNHMPSVYAEFHLPGLKFAIFHPKESVPPTRLLSPPSIGMSLCIEVENLEGAIAHLTELGYPPSGHILTASHGQEIYAYDPEGNWLILHQSNDRSIWEKVKNS